MNKHFEDSLYYLKRAGEHARLGVEDGLEPVTQWVRRLTGRVEEPEPTRVEVLVEDVRTLERRAEREAREAVGSARGRLEAYRPVR